MAGRVEGKVGIVTGAGHGMGAAHALALGREGASVACVDICGDIPSVPLPGSKEEELKKVVDGIRAMGRRAIPVKCDVSKATEVQRMVAEVMDEFGKIDILVNNAGVCTNARFWELSEDEWDTTIDVNLKGTWLCAKYVVPHMIAQRWGRIVNIGSIAGRSGSPTLAHYAASKAAVHMLTQAMARGVGEHNVTVNCIGPGAIMTPMLNWWGQETVAAGGAQTMEEYFERSRGMSIMGRQINPEDVANVMMWLVSEESWTLTGQVFYVDGGQRG